MKEFAGRLWKFALVLLISLEGSAIFGRAA